jgi:hypothetical protein
VGSVIQLLHAPASAPLVLLACACGAQCTHTGGHLAALVLCRVSIKTAAPRFPRRRRQPRARYGYGVQYERRGTVSSAAVDTQTSSDKESEAEVGEEEEESDDELCDRTKAPVPKWEALATTKAVWTQLCQELGLEQGSLG